MDGYLHHDIKPGEVVAWPTSIGWMMGPWLIYASSDQPRHDGPLLRSPRHARVLRVRPERAGADARRRPEPRQGVAEHGRRPRDLDWTSIKLFSSTGECSNSDDYLYLMSLAGTARSSSTAAGRRSAAATSPGRSSSRPPRRRSRPRPSVSTSTSSTTTESPTKNGELFIVPPSIGLSNTLLNKDHHEVYYADTPRGPKGELLRRHGDETEELPGGYFRGHGRADDTMNLGGIKVSSTEIERALGGGRRRGRDRGGGLQPAAGGTEPSRHLRGAVARRRRDPDTLKKDMQRAIAAQAQSAVQDPRRGPGRRAAADRVEQGHAAGLERHLPRSHVDTTRRHGKGRVTNLRFVTRP